MPTIHLSYKERNDDFLITYGQKAGVKELFEGILYRELAKGKGEKPLAKSMIVVHYTGKLINGKVFDATQKGFPATLKLTDLITGWKIALREMSVGSRWEIVIPAHLGYGKRTTGVIKPFSTLIFDVQLLAIQ